MMMTQSPGIMLSTTSIGKLGHMRSRSAEVCVDPGDYFILSPGGVESECFAINASLSCETVRKKFGDEQRVCFEDFLLVLQSQSR